MWLFLTSSSSSSSPFDELFERNMNRLASCHLALS